MRKIYTLFVGSSLVLQFLPIAALAELSDVAQQKREEVKKEIQQKRDAFKQEVQGKREAVKQEFREKRDALRQEFDQKREALKKEFEQKREALKRDMEKKREEFEAEAEKRKEELKKKLGERHAENIEKFFNKMAEKFEAAIKRLDDLGDRIDSRLNKAEANGKDVKALRDQLAKARGKIQDAQKALADAKAKYTEAAKSTDFKASFAKVRELVKGVERQVKEAHQALVDVINSVKGLGGGEEHKATSTPAQ